MRRTLLLLHLLLLGSLPLFAQEASHHNNYYMVVKALYSNGEKVDHETGTTLESEPGIGLGVDFGYTMTSHLSVELDFSYDKNKVEENNNGIVDHADGIYYTYAVDLLYTHHLTKTIALMGKVGLEVEDEEVKELGINTTESGVAYGVALEYVLTKNYEIVTEYEGSTIESPRGSSIFLGIKRLF